MFSFLSFSWNVFTDAFCDNSQRERPEQSSPFIMDSVTIVSDAVCFDIIFYVLIACIGNSFFEFFPNLASSGFEVRSLDQR
jgi:hypothetical protein